MSFHLPERPVPTEPRRRFALAPLPLQALALTATIWCVIQMQAAGVQPFIYFQF